MGSIIIIHFPELTFAPFHWQQYLEHYPPKLFSSPLADRCLPLMFAWTVIFHFNSYQLLDLL